MKTKLIATLLLAGSSLFAGPRIGIGIGIGVPVAPAPGRAAVDLVADEEVDEVGRRTVSTRTTLNVVSFDFSPALIRKVVPTAHAGNSWSSLGVPNALSADTDHKLQGAIGE